MWEYGDEVVPKSLVLLCVSAGVRVVELKFIVGGVLTCVLYNIMPAS